VTNVHYITPSEILFTLYCVTWLLKGDCDISVTELHVTLKGAKL